MKKYYSIIIFGVASLLTRVQTTCPAQSSGSPAKSQLITWSHIHSQSPRSTATNPDGIPMPSLTASQAIGTRGHVLLQDTFLIEKTASFNRERIPERVVHAKGAGAFGFFQVTDDVSQLTKADVFNQIGKKTPVFARFSTVAGESGSADTYRDARGFAVKFYTSEGNYDLVGNVQEVFGVRDAMLFPDVNRSRKRNPATHLPDATMWWDFASLRPETAHQALLIFSDMGNGYRVVNGSGVHTFKWVNADKATIYVKYHWVSNQAWSYLSKEEAQRLEGVNPDYSIQDLYDAIERDQFPSWDLYVQTMTFAQAETHPQNPFDSTKLWRREKFPLRRVGKMTLNRNPTDYFSQVEMAAFSPSHMVPGIEPSPDRLLHARMFSYPDAQRYRLGPNFGQLPINRPISRVENYFRDGQGRYNSNGDGSPNYYPNSFHGLEQYDEKTAGQTVFKVGGDVARVDTGDDDNFSLARLYLERDLDAGHYQRLVDNLGEKLAQAEESVQRRYLKNVAYQISTQYGDSVTKALEREKAKLKKTKVKSGEITE